MAAKNAPATPATIEAAPPAPAPPDSRELRASVDRTSAKAQQAMVAVGLSGASTAAQLLLAGIAVSASGLSELMYGAGAVRLVAAILYCQWLYRAHADAARLGGPPVVRPAAAVQAFFVPVANVYLPYRVLRDLHAASDPRTLHDPPQYKAAAGPQYRSSGLERIAAPLYELWFPVRAWWATYMGIPLLLAFGAFVLALSTRGSEVATGAVNALYGGLGAASTVLAICVVRSIVARQRERLRRLEALLAANEGASVEVGVHTAIEAPVRVEVSGPRVAAEERPVREEHEHETDEVEPSADARRAAARAGK